LAKRASEIVDATPPPLGHPFYTAFLGIGMGGLGHGWLPAAMGGGRRGCGAWLEGMGFLSGALNPVWVPRWSLELGPRFNLGA